MDMLIFAKSLRNEVQYGGDYGTSFSSGIIAGEDER